MLILVIHSPSMIFRRRNRRASLLEQLHRLIIHHDALYLGVIRKCICVKDLLHACNEPAVRFRRNDIVLNLALRYLVFLACAESFDN